MACTDARHVPEGQSKELSRKKPKDYLLSQERNMMDIIARRPVCMACTDARYVPEGQGKELAYNCSFSVQLVCAMKLAAERNLKITYFTRNALQ